MARQNRNGPAPPIRQTSASAIENRLLAALPRDEYERLSPHLELVHLPRNRILCEAGEAIQYGYFLNDGMASLLALTEDGQTIDIGTVGSEGFIGDDLITRVEITPCRVMTQFPCAALRIEAEPLLQEFQRSDKLLDGCLPFV